MRGRNAIGVIMTSMGDDGGGACDMQMTPGPPAAQDGRAAWLRRHAARAIRLGATDSVVPLSGIAPGCWKRPRGRPVSSPDRAAGSASLTSAFCARWRSAWSITTSASMASAMAWRDAHAGVVAAERLTWWPGPSVEADAPG